MILKANWKPSESDLSPSLIGRNLRATRNRDCRIARPMVREGYLRQGRNSDGSDRGRERFVALDWDEALDLAAEAIGINKAVPEAGQLAGGQVRKVFIPRQAVGYRRLAAFLAVR